MTSFHLIAVLKALHMDSRLGTSEELVSKIQNLCISQGTCGFTIQNM